MTIHVFSQALHLPAGLPMGGYTEKRLSTSESNDLEVNGLSFTNAESGRVTELYSIDALYAGDLVDAVLRKDCSHLFAASHTHYAPMLDGEKPLLGALASEAVNLYAQAINSTPRIQVAPVVCRIFRADVPVPVYRRFDVPDTALNRLLTSRAGRYPNVVQAIDRQLYIFEFASNEHSLFTLVYHACHPVSRHDRMRLSADYVDAIRKAVRGRFGEVPCLFLQGCAGDIRPNLAHKRVSWLPRSRLNWRFEKYPLATSEAAVDHAYADAVRKADVWQIVPLAERPLCVENRTMKLKVQGDLDIPCLIVADRLRFEFVPFEVSHHFHLAAHKKNPNCFIVSCANHTHGYLPHPKQLSAGGYEVDGSRTLVGLGQRVELKEGAPW
jgi:hypothetical protein